MKKADPTRKRTKNKSVFFILLTHSKMKYVYTCIIKIFPSPNSPFCLFCLLLPRSVMARRSHSPHSPYMFLRVYRGGRSFVISSFCEMDSMEG
jgi:hypothetical protein